ncbi:MAG: hypothetical protein AAF250_11390 [Pseudomonadota bacterium]
MEPPIWIGIIGTIVMLGFLFNGLRLIRGPKGHAANAGALHIAMAVIALPVMWLVVAFSTLA